MKNPDGTGLLTLLEQRQAATRCGDYRRLAQLEKEIAEAKSSDAMARRIAGISPATEPVFLNPDDETPDAMARRIANAK